MYFDVSTLFATHCHRQYNNVVGCCGSQIGSSPARRKTSRLGTQPFVVSFFPTRTGIRVRALLENRRHKFGIERTDKDEEDDRRRGLSSESVTVNFTATVGSAQCDQTLLCTYAVPVTELS